MIIFHEGLPRSGKSFEAVTRVIAKALKSGRPVDAYIEGLNHAKIAECCELEVDVVQQLLRALTREEAPRWPSLARKNALVVLDEAQNFWPTGRQRLTEEMTRAVTEHGHLGQDLLLMGQSHKDVHVLFRRRIDKLIVFNKADAIGMDKRYSVTTYKATRPEKFEKIGFHFQAYDERWFGSYASHVDSDVQTENFSDDRLNILKGKFFRFVVPATVVGVVVGGVVLYRFFNPEAPQAPVSAPGAKGAPVVSAAPAAASVVIKPTPTTGPGLVADFNRQYRPRLAWHYAYGGREDGMVEWWDGEELRETLTFRQLRHLGVDAFVSQGVARIGDRWVTAWPVPVRNPATAPDVKVPLL